MTAYQNSLSSLFKAEDEANEIIRRAEARREELLEQAVHDATAEINELRQKEARKFEDFTASNKNNFQEIEKSTEDQKRKGEEEYKQNKAKVVDFLLDRICTVNLDLQRNVKGDFAKTYKAANN